MKFILFCCLSMISLPGFSQGGSVHVMRAPVETAPVAAPQPSAPQDNPAPSMDETSSVPQGPVSAPAETIIYDEENADIVELERARDQRRETIGEMDNFVPEEIFDPVAELKKLGHKDLNLDTLLDEKAIPIFTRIFKESNLKDQKPEVVKAAILEKFKGQPLEKLFIKCPKCLDVFVDVLRDPEAMPSLLQIFQRKQDLKKFGMIWIGMLIFLFFFKRKIIPKSWPFYKRLPVSLIFSVCFTVMSFFVFYSMFTKETRPTLNVVKKYL